MWRSYPLLAAGPRFEPFLSFSLSGSFSFHRQGDNLTSLDLLGMQKGFIDSGVNTIAHPLQGTIDSVKEMV
jgi:hypothetical protein